MFQLLEEMKLINNGLDILDKIKENKFSIKHARRIKWDRLPANIVDVIGTMLWIYKLLDNSKYEFVFFSYSAELDWMLGIPSMFNESYDKFLVLNKVCTKYMSTLHCYEIYFTALIIGSQLDMSV